MIYFYIDIDSPDLLLEFRKAVFNDSLSIFEAKSAILSFKNNIKQTSQ